jgi:hypothetical protein
MAPDKPTPPRSKRDPLDWFTVSYRTLYVLGGLLVVLLGGAAYWMLGPPSHLGPPPSTTAPAQVSARFLSIEGGVQVKFSGTLQWVAADRAMVLNKGDLVRTGSGAAAEIRFFDNTVFQVRPDSLITIEESFEDPASKKRQVAARIQSGEVNFQAPARNVPGSATTISTPTVRTTTGDDTAGNINVRDTGDSGIRIYKGSARAESTTGEKVDLGANTAVKVDAGGKLGPKIALPGVPTLLAPPHKAEIAYPDPPRATTLLAWKPVTGATGYRVVLDVTASFARPLVDRRDWKTSSMELQGLEVGTYYWQVAAIDKDGAESSFTEFARFSVTRAVSQPSGAPPQLSLEPLQLSGNIVQVKGRTEPGASVAINGQRVDVAADGTFNEFITLETGQAQVVVRSTSMNGGVSEQRRPVAGTH